MSRRAWRWVFGVFLLLLIAGGVSTFVWRGRLRVLPYDAPGAQLVYDVAPEHADETIRVLQRRLANLPRADVRAAAPNELTVTVWPANPEAWSVESASLDLQRIVEPVGALAFHRMLPRDAKDASAMLARETPDRRAGDLCHWARVSDRDARLKDYEYGAVARTYFDQIYVLLDDDPAYCMTHNSGAANWSVVEAKPSSRENGALNVSFKLDDEGARQFGKLTAACLHQRLAIVVDDVVYTAPNVASTIPGGQGIIDGGADGYAVPEQLRITSLLNAGTLPAPLGEPLARKTGDFTVPPQRTPMLIATGVLGVFLIGMLISGYRGFIRQPGPRNEVLTA